MSNKLNGFENYIIRKSVKQAIKQAEEDILKLEKEGKRSICASGYFTMLGVDLFNKIDSLTLKSALKSRDNG